MKASAIAKPRDQRVDLDAYYTPVRLAVTIARHVQLKRGHVGRILEPSCGDGAFVMACRSVWPESHITAIDVNQYAGGLTMADMSFCCSFKGESSQFESGYPYDLIIGNPPFKHAAEHIDHAFTLLRPRGVIAMLLPLSFLGGHGKARGWFWKKHGAPKRIDTITPRPSFEGQKGTAATEYAAMMWGGVEPGNDFVRWER
jgi:hypothetical protein